LTTRDIKGVHYIIEREGKPIASMKSIDEKTDPVTLNNMNALLRKLQNLDEELDALVHRS